MNTENNLPNRKPLRLKYCNYNANGSYFITFCTHNRKNTLVSNYTTNVSCTNIRVWANYSEYGKIVDKYINNARDYFGVSVDLYAIMPNHVHLIVSINDETIVDEKAKRSVVSKVVGYIKMNATKEINAKFGKQKIWQRGFYDHVIRNEQDYDEIAKYVQENPYKWNLDSLYNEDLPAKSIN